MNKYISVEKLIAELRRQKRELELSIQSQGDYGQSCHIVAYENILSLIISLQQEQDMGEVSDGYHTFNELYYYRMLYNAAFFNSLPKDWVHKSKRHHTGEECFGGGWFIVIANLPTGQVSNHYELKDWDLFKVPEKEFADEWDGHTPQEASDRLRKYLQQEQPEVDLDLEKELKNERTKLLDAFGSMNGEQCLAIRNFARHFYGLRNRALEEAARHVYESWMGGTMDDVRRDMVELGKVLNARKK